MLEVETSSTDPHPPKRSLPQPYTTRPMPTCRSAEAHMTHGSTVTYSVIWERGGGLKGSRWSIASSSACSVACMSAGAPGRHSGGKGRLTLRHSLVRLRARAIALPSRTKTQPTGTSSLSRASSAWSQLRSSRRLAVLAICICGRNTCAPPLLAGKRSRHLPPKEDTLTITRASRIQPRSTSSWSSGAM